jgi:replication factor A1
MTSEVEVSSNEKEETEVKNISSLEPRMKSVNVAFKVIGKGEINEIVSRRDGTRHQIADAHVADSSGSVIIPLWDQSIEKLETGKSYLLKNGFTGLYRGQLRLKIGNYSEIELADNEIEEVNLDVDMSEKDHSPPQSRHYYQSGGGYGYRPQSRGYGSRDRRSNRDRGRRRRRW